MKTLADIDLCGLLRTCGADDAAPAGRARQLAPPRAVQLETALALLMARGGIVRMPPVQRWALLEAALLAPRPSLAFETLRQHRVLAVLVPELPALFGVPQLSAEREWQDVGEHQWRFVDETAAAAAPIESRFAALIHKLGKAGTPPEIWPSHYRHEQRTQAALQALARRVELPAAALAFAQLAVDELDHLHAVHDLRAGPIAQLLHRLQASRQPERFEQLLALAACDWAAYCGQRDAPYPKAARLRLALQAASAVDTQGLADDDALQAQARAIHAALRPR